MELTPSERVLLSAKRFAPPGLGDRAGEEIDNVLPYGAGIFLAIALAYALASQGGVDPWVCWLLGGAATAAVLAAWVWKRFLRPDRALLGRIDESKLERTLFAAALLANAQQGLLRLMPDGIELRAEPTGTPPRWPTETLEQGLPRVVALPVSELVSDWRAAYPWPLAQLAESAGRRGLLQANPSQTGPLWIPCPAALAALDPGAAAKLLDDCRLRQPEVWNALEGSIEAGFRRRATAPNQRFEAGAMPDSLSPAELEQRQRIYDIPAGAKVAGVRSAAVIWISIFGWSAFCTPFLSWLDLDASPPYALPRLPFVVAAAVAVACLLFDRGYRPAEPPPAPGMSDEEAALARERSLSLRHPPWRESLTSTATLSGLACGLGLILCPLAGEFIYVLAVATLAASICFRIVLARLPSAREVELAVARRSRELSAAQQDEPEGDADAVSPSVAAASRPLLEINARDLPPPTATARTRTDQRRRAALFLLGRNWTAFALLAAAAALLTAIFSLRMGYDPSFLLFAVVPLAILVLGTRQGLDAWYRLRPVAWQHDGSRAGRAMRTAARMWPLAGEGMIPDLGRKLQDLVAAEPEFWRDEELQITSPLGGAPTICLTYWLLFVPTAFLIVPVWIIQTHTIEALAFTAAGLALPAAYVAYLRSARAAMARQAKFEPGVRLLMLRVFGSPSFDELISLMKPWLLVGPISHLEGYDSIVRSPEARKNWPKAASTTS